MKKFFYSGILILFLLGHSSVAQEKPEVDSSYANGYYLDRLELFRELPERQGQVVFLGNSITEAGNWEERSCLGNVVNRGISGDNSFGVYARLQEILSTKPEKIFLMIGVNDLKRGTPVEYILNNHARIARKVSTNSPEVELYIQSVLPVREVVLDSIYRNITSEKIWRVNDGLLKIADRYKIPFINLNKEVFSNDKGELFEKFTTDGLHLSEKGYHAWIDYLKLNNYL